MAKSANAYVKIIVSSNIKKAMSDFKAAHPVLSKFGGIIKKVGLVGAAAFAAIVAGIYIMKKALTACLREYEDYMLGLVKVRRFTGMTARATSILAGQLRLSGVAVDKGTTGLRFFARNLDAARQGQKAMVEVFKRLNVELVDANGKMRSVDEVLFEVRDRFSEIEDPAKRTALAVKLFGKGGADLLPWLMRSAKEMEKYTGWIEQLGLVMGEKSMKAFTDYRENQRKLSIGWDAIKINAAAALVPLINQLMPKIIELIWSASEWLGKFRRRVEKKGWGQAFEEMVPGATTVIGLLEDLRDWWKKNKKQIGDTATQVGEVLKKLGEVVTWLAGNSTLVSGYFSTMFYPIKKALEGLNSIISAITWIKANIQGVGNFSKGGGGGGGGGGGADTGPATGGITTGPISGYKATLHGTELVLPLNGNKFDPHLYDYGSGGSGDTIVNVFLDGKLIEKQVTKRQSERLRRLERAYA